jgi:hypothetical protein
MPTYMQCTLGYAADFKAKTVDTDFGSSRMGLQHFSYIAKEQRSKSCTVEFHQYLYYAVTTVAKRLHLPTEIATIKAILEPYWHMFSFVLEHEKRPITYALVPWKLSKSVPTIYIHHISESVDAIGAAAYSSWVSHQLRRSSQKYNHCDYSIRLFLHHLSSRLGDVKADIKWLAVYARPRILFHWHGYPLRLKVRHSVFSITTESGEEYIADFTIEQFGYPSSMWFMKKKEYVARCTTGEEMEQPCRQEIASVMRGEIQWSDKVLVVSEVCRKLESGWWKRWDKKERIWRLEDLVRQTFRGTMTMCTDGEASVSGIGRATMVDGGQVSTRGRRRYTSPSQGVPRSKLIMVLCPAWAQP